MEVIDFLKVIAAIAAGAWAFEMFLLPFRENIKRRKEKEHIDVTERLLRDILGELGAIKKHMMDNEMVTSFILSSIKKKTEEEKND